MAAPAPPVWLPAVPAPGPIALPPPAGPAPAGAPPAGNFGLYTGPERDHGLTWLMRNAVLAEPAAGGAFPVNSFGWLLAVFWQLRYCMFQYNDPITGDPNLWYFGTPVELNTIPGGVAGAQVVVPNADMAIITVNDLICYKNRANVIWVTMADAMDYISTDSHFWFHYRLLGAAPGGHPQIMAATPMNLPGGPHVVNTLLTNAQLNAIAQALGTRQTLA